MTATINRRGVLLGATALAAAGFASAVAPSWGQQESADRTNHALLVAVTDYPELPSSANLVGPANDARLVREFLTTSAVAKFEPANVTVLADIEDATSPTRDAIRAELDRLAETVKQGDFVYLQFSGHGIQQPSMDPSIEPDGLDEVFLPRDTGMWKDRSQGIPNAFVDKEFRAYLQTIRDKGAFIWAVFDCCHSGTMTRAAGLTDGEEVDRKIDFELVGIPESAMRQAVAESESASRGIDASTERKSSLGIAATGATSIAPAGMVAFFAAQTTETTPEMMLPRGSETATRLGLFTFTLFSKIAENPGVTYRQLGQAILQAYSADNRTRPTPLFEGDLDKPVFGMSDADRIAQWPIRIQEGALEIPAGQLHRLSPGAKLAVLPSPGSPLDQAIGYVEVATATNLTSRIVPVEYEGMAKLAPEAIPAGHYARLTDIAIGFELVVARPDMAGEFSAEIEMINAALDKIASDGAVPVNLRFVGATEDADIKLAVMSEMDVGVYIASQRREEDTASRAGLGVDPQLWLLPPSAELSLDEGRRAPSLPLSGTSAEEIAEKLADNLVSIFRATSLSRLAAAGEGFGDEKVTVGFQVLDVASGTKSPLQGSEVPVVHPEDQVHLQAANGSSKPVDINVLYIGSDYSIGHMYAERLHPESEIDIPLLAFTETSYGMERMVVVLSEAEPMTPVEDLSFLAQTGVRHVTRAAGLGSATFGDLLRDVAGAPATRGAARIGEKAGAKGAVMVFSLETTPRG